MRKRILFVLIYSLAVVFNFTCSQAVSAASGGPNNVSIQTQPAQSTPQQTQTVNTANNKQLELAKEQLRGDFYKEALDKYKSAFYFIIGLVVTFVGYASWRNSREYREVVADAKNALRDVMDARKESLSYCEKAREHEQQAQDKLTSINTTITEKLDEIKDKSKELLNEIKEEGKKQIDESIKEGERQRKVSELWSKAVQSANKGDYELEADSWRQIAKELKEEDYFVYNNWGAALAEMAKLKKGKDTELLLKQSIDKFNQSIKINPYFHMAYGNLAASFHLLAKEEKGDVADKLFKDSFENYQKAIELKSDSFEIYDNWGSALLFWYIKKEGNDKEAILNQAEEKLLKAESIKFGSGSYNLACLFGIRGDKDKCRQWLEIAEKAVKLVTREHAIKDEDLKIVRDEEWFKNLRFKGE